MFKKICVGLCLTIVSVLFTGCIWDSWTSLGGAPDYSMVRAYISQDYNNEFDAKEYTLESFNMTNAKDFSYRYYSHFDYEVNNEVIERFFLINLKSAGKQNAQSALDLLIQLEFIDRVDFSYGGMNPGTLFD